MKKKHRLTGLLTAAVMLSGMIPAGIMNAAADVVEEVSTMKEFKTIMQADRDCTIKLTKDISETINRLDDPVGAYWLYLGNGTKEIDLNGHDILVSNNCMKDIRSSMFMIPPGTTLVIDDDEDKGEILYNGWISANEDYSKETANINRDTFFVNGGQLIINGGQITAGRAKYENVWCPFFVDPDGQDGWQTASSSVRVSKYINGTAIDMIDGRVTINGGCFTGRGFEYIDTKKLRYTLGYDYSVTEEQGNMSNSELRSAGLLWNSSQRAFDRNAIIETEGGKLIINDGNFYAKGNADCLHIENPADADVKAGLFRLHFNDNVLIDEDKAIDGSYGAIGLPVNNFYFDRVKVTLKNSKNAIEYDGTDLTWFNESLRFCFQYKRFSGEDEPYIEIAPCDPPERETRFSVSSTKYYMNDKSSKMEIKAGFDKYFTDSYCIRDGMHRYTRMWYIADMDNLDNYVNIGEIPCDPDKAYTLDDKELADLRKIVKAGHDYFITIIDKEYWEGTHSYVRSVSNTFTFSATDAKPVKITQQPESVSDVVYMGSEMLTAKAENAKTARWYCSDPIKGVYPCGDIIDLDETGVASITVGADGKKYFCRFSNGKEFADTKSAEACFKPTFRIFETTKTFVRGEDAEISIPCDYDSEHPCSHIISDGWMHMKNGMESPLTNSDKYRMNGNTLTITNVSSNQPFYIFRYYETEHGKYYSTGVRVEVVDGTPEKTISTFELKGIGNLFLGDKAPTIDDISTPSDKYTIESISWYGVDKNGYINSPNASYSIVLTPAEGYSFKFDNNGDLKGYMEGRMLKAYGSPNGHTSRLTVGYTYDNHTPLTEPRDYASLEQYDFSAERYEKVDIQLKAKVVCPAQHADKHGVKSYAIPDYSSSYHLPDGLTMDSNGHITGVLKADEGIQNFFVDVKTTGGDISTVTCSFTVTEHKHHYEFVTDPETGDATMVCTAAEYCGAEPIPVPADAHTFHNWNKWTSDNDDTHSCTCKDCSVIMKAPHSFDDGVITVEATEEEKGTIVYTCTECGYQRIEEIEYEGETKDDDPTDGEDFVLGDVNGDGKVNVSDIAKAAAHVKGKKALDDKAQKRADTNSDGKVNIADISKIAAHVKGKKLLA